MSEKPKVQTRHISPKSAAANYTAPSLHTVVSKLILDDEAFLPVYNAKETAVVLKVNIPWNHSDPKNMNQRPPLQLPHRSTVLVNCGFSMEIPAGYRAVISPTSAMAARGLMVVPTIFEDKVEVYVTNVGREIVVLNHGDAFAELAIEPVYQIKWER